MKYPLKTAYNSFLKFDRLIGIPGSSKQRTKHLKEANEALRGYVDWRLKKLQKDSETQP